jgi:hypothetical protein
MEKIRQTDSVEFKREVVQKDLERRLEPEYDFRSFGMYTFDSPQAFGIMSRKWTR